MGVTEHPNILFYDIYFSEQPCADGIRAELQPWELCFGSSLGKTIPGGFSSQERGLCPELVGIFISRVQDWRAKIFLQFDACA